MTLTVNRDLFWVIVGRVVAAILALVSIRVVTTFLSPTQYGQLALLIAIQMFCGLFLVNPIGQYINLHTHQWWDEGSLGNRLKPYRYYIFAVAIVGGIATKYINQEAPVNDVMVGIILMGAMIIAGTWNATLVSFLNMLGFRASSTLCSSITVLAGLIASILLVYYWQHSAVAWFTGQAIGMAIGAIGAKLVLRQHGLHSNNAESSPLFTKEAVLVYCLPLAFATGLMWVQLSGYRFLIEHYWGLAQLGFLAIGFQLAGQVFSLLESLAMQFFYPMFFRRVSAHENVEEVQMAFSDLLNTLIPLYFLLAGLVILNAPNLLKILVAPQYQGAMFFVVLGACIELCRVLGNLLSNAAHVKRNTKSLALPYLLGSLATFALICFFGFTQRNIDLAITGLLIGNVTMLITMFFCMYQQMKFSLDLLTCIGGLAIMLGMALLSMFMPYAQSIASSMAMLLLTSGLCALSGFTLLRKNPALFRLLNVRLRAN